MLEIKINQKYSLKSFLHVFAFFNLSVTALNMLLSHHVKSKPDVSLNDKNNHLYMYSRPYGESLFRNTQQEDLLCGEVIKC